VETFTDDAADDARSSERQRAFHDLGQACLARLDAASIASAAEAVGLIGLPSENLPEQVEARRVSLEARMTAILEDPLYANRELLRHPHTGSLTTAIADAEGLRRPASQVVATCERHPHFITLWTNGFGSPAS
jgi:hypothetical protein